MKRKSDQILDASPIVNQIKSFDGIEEVRFQGHLIKKIETIKACNEPKNKGRLKFFIKYPINIEVLNLLIL